MSILALCKFTPLGFETADAASGLASSFSVNLPRWGLKHVAAKNCELALRECKFTPLGFETVNNSKDKENKEYV